MHIISLSKIIFSSSPSSSTFFIKMSLTGVAGSISIFNHGFLYSFVYNGPICFDPFIYRFIHLLLILFLDIFQIGTK